MNRPNKPAGGGAQCGSHRSERARARADLPVTLNVTSTLLSCANAQEYGVGEARAASVSAVERNECALRARAIDSEISATSRTNKAI